MPPTVFVTSATGSVGSALCRQLISLNWQVRATTQNPSSKSAQSLSNLGVQFTQGDWDNEAAIAKALTNCDKLFLCLLPDLRDFNKVPQRASKIANLAKQAGVKQAIALTTLGAWAVEEGTKPPPEHEPSPFFRRHFHAKKRVEDAIINGGFDHFTILRPGFFMANFLEPKIHMGYGEIREHGVWTTSLTENTPVGLIDHVDIARFAVSAFQKPELWHGKFIAAVSQELTVQETLDTLARAIGDGRVLKGRYMTDEECAEEQKRGSWRFFSSETCVRYGADYTDLDELRGLVGGPLMTFGEFLEREKEGVRQTYLSLEGQT